MSKSKKNVVDPDQIILDYGADTARWFMLSDSPPERDLEWTESGVTGAWRFQQRLFRIASTALALLPPAGTAKPAQLSEAASDLRRAAHKTIAGVSTDIEAFHFNKAVARLYELANTIDATKPKDEATKWALREALEIACALAGPMTPHLAEELWQALGLVAAGRFAVAAGRRRASGRRYGDCGGTAQRQAAWHPAARQGHRQGRRRKGRARAARDRSRARRQGAEAGNRGAEQDRERGGVEPRRSRTHKARRP
jgi:methionyl-tRNA synthetase